MVKISTNTDYGCFYKKIYNIKYNPGKYITNLRLFYALNVLSLLIYTIFYVIREYFDKRNDLNECKS